MSQEGTYLKVVKVIYGKSTAKITLNGEKLKSSPLKQGRRQGDPPSPPLFNTALEVLAMAIGEENQ